TPPVPFVIQNSINRVTPEIASRAAAANNHRPKPRPVSHDTTAPSTAPPAPTGAITLPTQLMKFRKLPSGCAPVCPCTATLNCGAAPRFCAATNCTMASSKIAATTRGFFHPRSASNFLTEHFSFPKLIDCLPNRRNWRRKSDRCATESSPEPKSCQTGANSAGMKDQGIRETQNGERSNARNGVPGAWLLQPGIVQLGHVPANPLGGLFEIGPVQGRQLVAIGHSIESHALGGRANRLEIRRSHPAETFGNLFNRYPTLQASAFEVEPEQLHSLCSFRRRNQKFLGEPAASKYPGIDVLWMIGRAHQKHIVFRLQVADFRKKLFHELDIVLRKVAVVRGQQSIHFIEEDDCGTVLLGARENSGHTLDRISDASAQNSGCGQRIEAPLGLARDQARDQRLSCSWGPDQQQTCGDLQPQRMRSRWVFEQANDGL